MRRIVLFYFLLLIMGSLQAQHRMEDSRHNISWKSDYRGTYPKINDLVHTKLDVRFDYGKQWMYGNEWLTLQPHFYPTDSLTLDAKYMDIKEISMVSGKSKTPLKYTYDSLQLHITLDKTYEKGENYTLYINYISRPNQVKAEGSAAITEAKGLYFINPLGTEEGPTQIWTQGETEANSVWMPTIDKPNQKTTQEISMTVPDKYVTLSNGLMTTQKKNADGTRTDTWKMDLPNAPYLFFMGVGDYVIVKDQYKKMPVNYYVEKEYAPVAMKIFGETPAMIGYFSKILNFPYVWPKYDQIVGRDYVSGAMENTTATLHQDGAYQNARQLVDGNKWESTISHELFHHWFGDLVTAESWSNITLNESFADYAEYLWNEYRHGKDFADDAAFEEMQQYLMSNSNNKDLVRFYYKDKEDVFDAVSYNKGGRILQMLRTYVGDSAFFTSLNKYLREYQFQSAEAQQLRLAFESVTGKDMNWFWNQWYYGSGQPELDINYQYEKGQERVIVKQVQKDKLFQLPVAIDVYSQTDNKERYNVWVKNASDTFYFASAQKPSWVNFDGDKALLALKTDNKSADEFLQQYKYGPKYLDRREALEYFAAHQSAYVALGLNDSFAGLRLLTMQLIDDANQLNVPSNVTIIEKIATKDPDKVTQAKALELLGELKEIKYLPLFEKYVNDSSYSVSGAALEGLAALKPQQAYSLALKFSNDALGDLGDAVSSIIFKNGTEKDFDVLLNIFKSTSFSSKKIIQMMKFAQYLTTLKNTENVKKGVDEINKLRSKAMEAHLNYLDQTFQQALSRIAYAQKQAGNKELADYINGLL